MSRTTVYAAPSGGKMVMVKEYSNAWLSAAWVWSALCKRWLGSETFWISACPDRGRLKPLWDLADDDRLSRFERAVLLSTYDWALVDRPHFLDLATCFREFATTYANGDKVSSHLPAFANLLDRLAGDEHGLDFTPEVVGWHQTSVGDNLWRVRVGEEDSRPYDLAVDTDHWCIFDRLE